MDKIASIDNFVNGITNVFHVNEITMLKTVFMCQFVYESFLFDPHLE